MTCRFCKESRSARGVCGFIGERFNPMNYECGLLMEVNHYLFCYGHHCTIRGCGGSTMDVDIVTCGLDFECVSITSDGHIGCGCGRSLQYTFHTAQGGMITPDLSQINILYDYGLALKEVCDNHDKYGGGPRRPDYGMMMGFYE